MPFPSDEFTLGMHRHQREFFGHFDYRLDVLKRRNPQFFHLEWHRRARKTTAAINLLIRECCRVPNGKYVYVAPTEVQARNIIWDDPTMLRAYLPDKREMGWKRHEKMLVTFENGSMLKIGGSDKPDSIKGIDAIGAVFDEWSLIKYETWTEVFRPIMAGPLHPRFDGIPLFRWAVFIYTPKGMNHATRMFDNACCLGRGGELPTCGVSKMLAANTFASRLDGELSGILIPSEIKAMKAEVARGEIPQAFYDQETRCSRVTAEEMTLITTEMMHELNEHHRLVHVTDIPIRKIVAIDPAWGGDVCQIYGMRNMEVICQKAILERHRGDAIAMAAKLVAQDLGTKNFIVDTVNDRSVFEALSGDAANYNCREFKSSRKPTEKEDSQTAIKYVNRRAEAYAFDAKMIRSRACGPIKDPELMRQLALASKYKTQPSSGKLIILPKDKIKVELGCSPDKADTHVMGVWGTQFVDPEPDGPQPQPDNVEADMSGVPDGLMSGVL